MRDFAIRFLNDKRGAALPEYALLLGLIAAAIVGILVQMRADIVTIFTRAGAALTQAAT